MRLETQATEIGTSALYVVVHEGRVTELKVDGEWARSHEPSLYTVEGLFEVLGMELEAARPASDASQREQRPRAIVRAQFDPQTGVPVRFLRVIPGSNRSTEWRGSKWRRLAPGGSASSTTAP